LRHAQNRYSAELGPKFRIGGYAGSGFMNGSHPGGFGLTGDIRLPGFNFAYDPAFFNILLDMSTSNTFVVGKFGSHTPGSTFSDITGSSKIFSVGPQIRMRRSKLFEFVVAGGLTRYDSTATQTSGF